MNEHAHAAQLRALADLAGDMRQAQNDYFDLVRAGGSSPDKSKALGRAKQLERQLDQRVADILAEEPGPPDHCAACGCSPNRRCRISPPGELRTERGELISLPCIMVADRLCSCCATVGQVLTARDGAAWLQMAIAQGLHGDPLEIEGRHQSTEGRPHAHHHAES